MDKKTIVLNNPEYSKCKVCGKRLFRYALKGHEWEGTPTYDGCKCPNKNRRYSDI